MVCADIAQAYGSCLMQAHGVHGFVRWFYAENKLFPPGCRFKSWQPLFESRLMILIYNNLRIATVFIYEPINANINISGI